MTETAGVSGEIEGSSAQVLVLAKHIPKDLSDADDLHLDFSRVQVCLTAALRLRTKQSVEARRAPLHGASGNSQLPLHLFQGDTLCLRIEEQHHEELQDHHDGEEHERVRSGGSSHERENKGNQRIH